jgi:hypothetical protein
MMGTTAPLDRLTDLVELINNDTNFKSKLDLLKQMQQGAEDAAAEAAAVRKDADQALARLAQQKDELARERAAIARERAEVDAKLARMRGIIEAVES